MKLVLLTKEDRFNLMDALQMYCDNMEDDILDDEPAERPARYEHLARCRRLEERITVR